jgi:transcriptional regulator with XRE-family HTH domain
MAILCDNVLNRIQRTDGVAKKTEKQTAFRGDRLKWMREAKKLTQDEMSQLSGLAMSQISRYENGRSDPDAIQIRKLALALDVTSDYLLGLSDDPETSYRPEMKYTIQEQMLIAKWRAGSLDEVASEALSESIRRKKLNSSDDTQPNSENSTSDAA